ncbi:hypothetical protein ACFVGX_05365 [Streptomyces sp. NPDC127113]|uniref:hypothetical protein n=1 Tax=Streptomyces sp. NPDC127113 TaxID=3345365 RepID=UPI003624D06A
MTRTSRTGGGPQGGADVPRGRTRWWRVAALVAVPALILLPLLVAFVGIVFSESDERGEGGRGGSGQNESGRTEEQVPCSEALAFGGAVLPAGARPTGACTVQGFQDIHYSAAFHMPRTGVQDWLIHTYPDAPAPGTESCLGADADLCLDLGPERGLPGGADAHAVRVRVVYEDAKTALVRFTAFTM